MFQAELEIRTMKTKMRTERSQCGSKQSGLGSMRHGPEQPRVVRKNVEREFVAMKRVS